jgi:hypothetical protein
MSLEVTVPTTGTIRTMDVLRSLGFQTDTTVITDDGPGLSANFGGLRLTAGAYRKFLAEIVMITGVLATSRSWAAIHIEMPRYVEATHFVTAWIVWHLDQHSEFRKVHNLSWVEEGRNHQGLLPWVKSMADWEARPKLIVRRDWLRLALNRLAELLSALPDEANVTFSFDGSVFSIRSDGELIALAGQGTPWTVSFSVRAGDMRRLPKRLMGESIGISIWESRISIANRTYAGVLEGLGSTDPSRVQ